MCTPLAHRVGLVLALVPACVVGAQEAEPTWTLYRPGNTGIPGDYTQTLYIDEHDRPYVAAYTPFWEEGGMAVQDAQDPNRWTTISSVNYPALTSPRFNDIERAPDGTLWIASDGGLLHYDPAVGPSSLVRYDAGNSPMPTSQVFDVAIEPGGAVWLAIFDVSLGHGGLARFDPAANSWRVWPRPDPTGPAYTERVAVIPDATGGGFGVWFWPAFQGMGVYRNGVISPAPSTGGITPDRLCGPRATDNLGNAWMFTNQGLSKRAPDGTYTVAGYPAGITTEATCVTALRDGRVALGTAYSDVFVWNGSWSYQGNWAGSGGSHTYTFQEDSQGHLWTGGIGGAAKYSNGHWQRYRLTNQSMLGYWIQSIDFAPDGRVFMNGNAGPGVGGFNIFDGLHWTGCNDFNYGIGPSWGLPSDDVASLCVRANGHLAVAPAGGQGLLDWDGSTFTYLLPQFTDIISVREDTLGRLWAGAYYNGGVWLVAGTQATQFTPDNSPLPFGENESITIDRSNPGWVWLTSGPGIAHTNGVEWEIVPREQLGLTQNTLGYFFTGMDVASDGTWWVGSGRGLYHYNPATQQYTVYTEANAGLPSDEVDHVRVAPDGSVWISMFDSTYPYPGGLSHFDGTTWTHYHQGSSPLPHNQIWALESRTVPGGYEMWVGTASEGIAVVRVATGPACYANCDGSTTPPILNVNDFICFQGRFAAGDPAANCDGSSTPPVLNVNDFICFQTRFAAGCP